MIPDGPSVALVLRAGRLGIDPTRQGWEVELLERLWDMFRDDPHPITPWFALRWAREHKLPQPDWVLDHFVDLGKQIEASILSAPVNEAEAVGIAVGFRAAGPGKAPPGAEAVRQGRDWGLAFDFELERALSAERGDKFKEEAAIAAVVARNGDSYSTVRRAAKKYGEVAAVQVRLVQQVFLQD